MDRPAVTDRGLLRRARPTDLSSVLGLLAGAGLPSDGVSEAFSSFLVAKSGEDLGAGGAATLVGVAGLEVHGPDGVLRSVAVDPAWRGRGLGARLVRAIIDEARARGLRHLYLLTTTADAWFPRHGFDVIDRSAAEPAVLESVEFRDVCPASAVAMRLKLQDESQRSPEKRR